MLVVHRTRGDWQDTEIEVVQNVLGTARFAKYT